jgi:hypothetical protein
MPDITKHDSDKKRKSDDVKGCGVDLSVGRYSVSVHDLLGDVQDAIRVEFAGRLMRGLLRIENEWREVGIWLNM